MLIVKLMYSVHVQCMRHQSNRHSAVFTSSNMAVGREFPGHLFRNFASYLRGSSYRLAADSRVRVRVDNSADRLLAKRKSPVTVPQQRIPQRDKHVSGLQRGESPLPPPYFCYRTDGRFGSKCGSLE